MSDESTSSALETWGRLGRRVLPEGHRDAVWDDGLQAWMESGAALEKRIEEEETAAAARKSAISIARMH